MQSNAIEPKSDFPQVYSNKTKPETPKTDSETPKTDLLLMEMMTLIKEQNKTMVDIMMNMMQNLPIKLTPAPLVNPYQS